MKKRSSKNLIHLCKVTSKCKNEIQTQFQLIPKYTFYFFYNILLLEIKLQKSKDGQNG